MDTPAALPDYLTSAQVAGWLAVPTAKVKRWAERGLIPAVSLPDGSFVFDPAALAAWSQTLPRVGACGAPREAAHAG